MPKLLIYDASTLLICEYKCHNFSGIKFSAWKIRGCKILDIYHVCIHVTFQDRGWKSRLMPGIMNIVARGPYWEAQDDPEEPLEGLQRGARPPIDCQSIKVAAVDSKVSTQFSTLQRYRGQINVCNTQCQIINWIRGLFQHYPIGLDISIDSQQKKHNPQQSVRFSRWLKQCF